MSDHEPELTANERAALDAWSAPQGPRDFAERVLAGADARSLSVRRWPWLVAAVALAAVVTMVALGGRESRTHGGETTASDRRSLAIGRRAVAVLEPGAAVSWSDDDGDVVVEQRAGDVFYRVDKGDNFVVRTAVGDVRVTGTCFRVEHNMSKKHAMVGGSVGAAMAAIVLVTVYEGGVVVAGSHGKPVTVEAGQMARISGDGVAAALPKHPAAANVSLDSVPPDDATREQLVARDGEQRNRIARLNARIAELEAGGTAKGAAMPGRDRAVGLTNEELVAMAQNCEVRFDAPDVVGAVPKPIDDARAAAWKLTAEQRQRVDAQQRALHTEWLETVRALYIEATGDEAGALVLSAQAMAMEIQDKGNSGNITKTLAEERAGLSPPPTDISQRDPYERYMRAFAALGDRGERLFADVLGADHARQIRGDGWGWRSMHAGCE